MEFQFRPMGDNEVDADYGDAIFDILAQEPKPGVGDTSQSAFTWCFLADTRALQEGSPGDVTKGLTGRAMHFAAGRLYLGGATDIFSEAQISELMIWYARRIATRMVDVVLARRPDPYDADDAKMMEIFRNHADLSTALVLDAEGKVRRAKLEEQPGT